MKVLQLLLIAACSLLAGMSGSLLSAFYPTEALRVGISISLTGHVFGVRSGGVSSRSSRAQMRLLGAEIENIISKSAFMLRS